MQGLVQLLNRNVVPQIPFRGGISASGDLSPLAYLAGLLDGRKGLVDWSGR